jgi:hypothetical protein
MVDELTIQKDDEEDYHDQDAVDDDNLVIEPGKKKKIVW